MRRSILAVCLAACALAAPAQAARRVPQGFVGTVVDRPMLGPLTPVSREYNIMVQAGVESTRVLFGWDIEQPYQNFDQVPADRRAQFEDVGGVPTDFTTTDRVVATAAAHRVRVLPVVTTPPIWAARHPVDNWKSPPSDVPAYARYLTALVQRYGPGGGFWRSRPRLHAQPIRDWQVWNEPNYAGFWSDQPFAADYVALLRAARAAIKGADPGARIVLAGLTNRSWDGLNEIYAAGGGGLFDVAAIHPFTRDVSGVITILRKGRAVLRDHGDARMPLVLSEMSWPAARSITSQQPDFAVTAAVQRRNLAAAYTRLAALRSSLRIESVYWYDWLSYYHSSFDEFDYAGLRTIGQRVDVSMPVFKVFTHTALLLENCRRGKAGLATRCRG